MNNNEFYQTPIVPNQPQTMVPPASGNIGPYPDLTGGTSLPMEQSYIENILRLNKGKMVHLYMSFPDSTEWRDKVFSGILEEAGKDHIVISDPSSGKWYLLLLIYLNYVVFDERINYSHSFSEKNF